MTSFKWRRYYVTDNCYQTNVTRFFHFGPQQSKILTTPMPKTHLNVFPLTLTSTLALNLKHKNLFGKRYDVIFLGKCPDTEIKTFIYCNYRSGRPQNRTL